ncbi:MAG TPA: LTA synthase family protein, partial [Verrucomicrobiae bacterium]|nr:LTA synthase family protein [Verrucomicrobiae bacterium]
CLAAFVWILGASYRWWRPRGSLLWLDILSMGLIVQAVLDLRLSQIMGVRLDWPALSLALGETPKMMWRMAVPYLPMIAAVLLLAIGLYAGVIYWFRRHRRAPEAADGGRLIFPAGAAFAVLTFVGLAVVGRCLMQGDKAEGQSTLLLAETSPLWKRNEYPVMDSKTFVERARELGMDRSIAAPATAAAGRTRDLNVILIFQESTYNRHLSLFSGKEETQPLLSRYKDRMELFPNFFSSFASSIHARFAAFTGLYPTEDFKSFTINRVGVKSIFELLHEHSYDCSLFYSSFFDYTGFRDFLRGRDLDGMYDADTMPGERKTPPVSWGLQEDETLEAMKTQIKKYAAGNQKFFLTYIPAAPHNPFDGTPQRFHKYHKDEIGDYTPVYLNELLYMDWVMSSLIDQLQESGILDHTLVIITADHGEMLGAKGEFVGHGWVVTPELANVPLIIMDPDHRGYRVNPTVGSQVDLPSTILDLLGIATPSGQIRQGSSLYSDAARSDRTIYLNSFRQYAAIKGRKIICTDRETPVDSRKVFEIQNNGAQTSFVAVEPPNAEAPDIVAFNQFQANLLHNYLVYCGLMKPLLAEK